MFVKITDASFMPSMYPDNQVQKCNNVFGKWVIDLGYGFSCDSVGDPIVPPWDGSAAPDAPAPNVDAIAFSLSQPTKIVVDFSSNVSVSDTTGFSVTIDAVGATGLSVVATGDEIAITIAETILAGESVLVSYVDGNVVSTGQGNTPASNFTDYIAVETA